VAKLLCAAGITDIVVLDRAGAIYNGRPGLSPSKQELASITNPHKVSGDLASVLEGSDVFVGVSGPNLLTRSDVQTMAKDAIVFALSNPVPEIMPEEAKKGGARVIATGRSDFPNQVNNALVFPGIFRGALDRGVTEITQAMKLKAAKALAQLVVKPTAEKIIPDVFDKRVVPAIAKTIR
jgi:malate dehydrogenase (oxaloacetate-decarboxylating)